MSKLLNIYSIQVDTIKDINGDNFAQVLNGKLSLLNPSSSITTSTSDGLDNASLFLAGGGDVGAARGGYIQLFGNESISNAGSAKFFSGSSHCYIGTQVSADLKIYTNNIQTFSFDRDGNLQFSSTSTYLKADTLDGSDNKGIVICGGGSDAAGRGGYVEVFGNEHTQAGNARLFSGGNGYLALGCSGTGNIYTNINSVPVQTMYTNGQIKWAGDQNSLSTWNLTSHVYDQHISMQTTQGQLRIGGGADTNTPNGGRIILSGIDNCDNPGSVIISAGKTTNTGLEPSPAANAIVNIETRYPYGIYFRTWDTTRLEIDENGYAIYYLNVSGIGSYPAGPGGPPIGGFGFKADSDGTDTIFRIAASSGFEDSSRGSWLRLGGNSATGLQGKVEIYAGNTSTDGTFNFGTTANTQINVVTNNTTKWTFGGAGHFKPTSDNTIDLGSPSLRVATLYSAAAQINDFNVLSQIRFNGPSNGDIYQITSDGSDNHRVRIGGGGDVASNRGAVIQLLGNESTQFASGGELLLAGGGVASGHVILETNNISAQIKLLNSLAHRTWFFDDSGTFQQDITNGGDIILNKETSSAALYLDASKHIKSISTLPIAQGGTGQSTQQNAIDALTAVAGAIDEYILTKDTDTGHALWKVNASQGTSALSVATEAQFVAALANLSCSNITIIAPFSLTANRIVTKSLTILAGCALNTSGHTLYVYGPFYAGDYQTFVAGSTIVGLTTAKVEWFGAIGDGLTDDSTAIQATITSLGSYSKLTFNAKTYKIGTTLYIPIGRTNFVIQGYGATLLGAVNGNILQISDIVTINNHCTNIFILGLTIQGSGYTDNTYPNQCGLEIDAIIGCYLKDVYINSIPKTGIIGIKSQASGSTYWNKVGFDNVSVRFCGNQYINIGTGGAVDDLECINCLFNHAGEKININSPNGAGYINAITLELNDVEISGNYSISNSGFGYRWGLHINNAAGVLSDMHFEDNANNQAGSADLLLDTNSHGLCVNGSNHYGSDATAAKFAIQVTSKDNYITGVTWAGSVTHTYDYIIEAGSASNFILGTVHEESSVGVNFSLVNGNFIKGATVNRPSGLNTTHTGRLYLDTTLDATGQPIWWNGSSWITPFVNVITAIGTYDSQTKSANGAVLSNKTLYLQSADISFPGLITTSAQTIAGNKTLSGSSLLFSNSILTILADTSDGSDNKSLQLSGGGGVVPNRGGTIQLMGNESTQWNAFGGGQVILRSGDGIFGSIEFELNNASALTKFTNAGTTVAAISQAGLFKLRAGSENAGNTSARIGGTINHNTTQTGNAANTETNLFSYSIPASVLGINGDRIDFASSGTFAASASTDKEIKIKFGSTTIFDTGMLSIISANSWSITGTIIRTGATTQKCVVNFISSSTVLTATCSFTNSTETLSNSLALVITGKGTNISDVVGEFLTAEWKSSST